jgi:hypothetical protein
MRLTDNDVRDAVRAAFDGDTSELIVDDDAFGALAYRVKEHCKHTGDTPDEVFTQIDEDALEFVPEADNPAAFLAAKVRDL